MAFGIGKLFKKAFKTIKKVTKPLLGVALGAAVGSISPVAGATITGALSTGPQRFQRRLTPEAVIAGDLSGGPRRFLPFTPGAPQIGGIMGGISGLPSVCPPPRRSPTQEILCIARMNTGRSVTVRQIVEAARVCGLEVAAMTFGLDVTQVCTVVVSRRRRRARGISAADLRRTRATLRKVTSIRKLVKAAAAGR